MSHTLVKNSTVTAESVSASDYNCGGLIGVANEVSRVYDCWVKTSEDITANDCVGGIVGKAVSVDGDLTCIIENCSNYGNITIFIKNHLASGGFNQIIEFSDILRMKGYPGLKNKDISWSDVTVTTPENFSLLLFDIYYQPFNSYNLSYTKENEDIENRNEY